MEFHSFFPKSRVFIRVLGHGGGIFGDFRGRKSKIAFLGTLIIQQGVEVMFFLLFSLKGIYWYGYQVLKCFFSGILKKKSWGGNRFWMGGELVSWGGIPPFPPCLRYNENPAFYSKKQGFPTFSSTSATQGRPLLATIYFQYC